VELQVHFFRDCHGPCRPQQWLKPFIAEIFSHVAFLQLLSDSVSFPVSFLFELSIFLIFKRIEEFLPSVLQPELTDWTYRTDSLPSRMGFIL
jgi:hypothetical protein